MKKRITEYLAYIDALLEKEDVDWEHEKEKHLVQIAFFAHERQVHLIVMALFALATVISILYLNFSGSLIIVALVFALLVLLIPYVMHYYLLENNLMFLNNGFLRSRINISTNNKSNIIHAITWNCSL